MITHHRIPLTLARQRQSQIRHEQYQARRLRLMAERVLKQGRTEHARHLLICAKAHDMRAAEYRALLDLMVCLGSPTVFEQPALLEAA